MKNLLGACRKLIFVVALVSVILYSITFLHPTFVQDEPFTFSLISHSFKDIVSLDAMDVHPPLYYLLLRLFIDITTFWTKSMFIKVIVARIFSLIAFILYVFCIKKIIDLCNLKVNLCATFITLLLIPVIISNVFTIRMAQLSALFMALEVLNLIKFNQSSNTRYLILAAIFVICNMYTFYFGGLSAGIYLFLFSIIYLYKKNYHGFSKILLSEITCILAFIPWLPSLFKQYQYHVDTDGATTRLTISQVMQNVVDAASQYGHAGTSSKKIFLIGLLILGLLFVVFVYTLKIFNKPFKLLMMLSVMTAVITLMISLIICRNKFQMNVLYPMFMIYAPLLMGVFIKHRIGPFAFNVGVKIVFMMFILFGAFQLGESALNNVRQYDIPSLTLIRNVNQWKASRDNVIKLKDRDYPVSKQMTIFQDAIYLKPLNKNLYVTNDNYRDLSRVLTNNSNTRLTRRLFSNIIIKR